MSTPSIAKSRNLNTAASKKRSVKSSATARRKVTPAAAATKVPPKSDEPKVARVTKQERLLTLLSQPEGASIEEMMQATECHLLLSHTSLKSLHKVFQHVGTS